MQRVITELVDDTDGTIIAEGQGRTVSFAFDGVTYEIDLTNDNAGKLESALAPWVTAGRRVGGTPRRKPEQKRSKEQTQAIRAWAIANGHQLADRGRIPADIEAAFHAAGGATPPPPTKKAAKKATSAKSA
jgi:hypothetical protein